jgi:hypothetical protein
MVKITAVVLALTMLASCGQLDDTSKAETKATSATVTTTTVGTWKPSFENATTFTTTTSATTTTTTMQTTKNTTTTKKVTSTVQNNSNNGNGGVAYYPSQDNNDYNYEDNQPSYSEDNSDNNSSYEQPQQTEQPRQTTTTKKEEQPSKPSGNKITQSDIDAMKAELTAYSREKATYIKEHYTEFWKYGIDYNTVEEYFLRKEGKAKPSDLGYDRVDTIEFTEGQSMLSDFKKIYMDYIDYEYEERNDVYYVVYVEACPNGLDVNPNPCWAVYLLY